MTIPRSQHFTWSPTAPTPAPLDNSNKLATTAYVDAANASVRDAIVAFTIGDGTNVIPTGLWDLIRIPAGEIVEVALAGKEASGSIVLDLWLDTYANLDPTVLGTITAAAKPTITAGKKTKMVTADMTGWSPTVGADSWLGLNVDSAGTFTLVRGYLIVRRS
jgi:hypothetical protein